MDESAVLRGEPVVLPSHGVYCFDREKEPADGYLHLRPLPELTEWNLPRISVRTDSFPESARAPMSTEAANKVLDILGSENPSRNPVMLNIRFVRELCEEPNPIRRAELLRATAAAPEVPGYLRSEILNAVRATAAELLIVTGRPVEEILASFLPMLHFTFDDLQTGFLPRVRGKRAKREYQSCNFEGFEGRIHGETELTSPFVVGDMHCLTEDFDGKIPLERFPDVHYNVQVPARPGTWIFAVGKILPSASYAEHFYFYEDEDGINLPTDLCVCVHKDFLSEAAHLLGYLRSFGEIAINNGAAGLVSDTARLREDFLDRLYARTFERESVLPEVGYLITLGGDGHTEVQGAIREHSCVLIALQWC